MKPPQNEAELQNFLRGKLVRTAILWTLLLGLFLFTWYVLPHLR